MLEVSLNEPSLDFRAPLCGHLWLHESQKKSPTLQNAGTKRLTHYAGKSNDKGYFAIIALPRQDLMNAPTRNVINSPVTSSIGREQDPVLMDQVICM